MPATASFSYLILSSEGKVLASAASRKVAERVYDETPGAAMVRRVEDKSE